MPLPTHEYYATLGVSRAASRDEIRKAYRKLARQHHPDFNAGSKSAEERFKNVQEAYEVLHNSRARRLYDEAAFPEAGASAGVGAPTAGAKRAAGSRSFEYAWWRKAGYDRDDGRPYPPPRQRISDISNLSMIALFAVGSAGFLALLFAFPLPDALRGSDSDALWMVGPIAAFVAAGFLLGGTAGNFWARAAYLNAALWCCLVPYWRIALKLDWPVIALILPWAPMTYLPIVFGVFLRQARSAHTRLRR